MTHAVEKLRRAQGQQKKYTDKRRRDVEFQVGDEVLLSTKTLPMVVAAGGSSKLGPLYCGPFVVLERHRTSYKVELPPHMKVHPVFHISQLKLYRRPADAAKTYEKLGLVIVDQETEEYEVDEVINHRKRKRGKKTKIEYLIVWKGYPMHESTWEPEENVANTPAKIAEYYRRVEGNSSLKEG